MKLVRLWLLLVRNCNEISKISFSKKACLLCEGALFFAFFLYIFQVYKRTLKNFPYLYGEIEKCVKRTEKWVD